MKDTNDIVNLDQFRNRKQEEKKRKTERIFFHNLVGVYSVIKPGKMVPVDLIDVSETGLAIQVPYDAGKKTFPTDSTNLPIRLYFSAESFMEVTVDIKNTHATIDGGTKYLRFGCQVNQDHRAFAAWTQFVGFLRAFSDVSERDTGNIAFSSL